MRHGPEDRELGRLSDQLAALGSDIAHARDVTHRRTAQFAKHVAHGERVVLPSGSEVLIRPVEPEDAALLEEGLDRLSAVSRYRRFLAPVRYLSRSDVESLTRVDHHDHEAFGVLEPVTGHGVGVGRYVRLPKDPACAEVAITVADEWQHQGIGRLLVERLARRAREEGIERFTARMLVGNDAGERLLEHVGDVVETLREPGTLTTTVRLRGRTSVHSGRVTGLC